MNKLLDKEARVNYFINLPKELDPDEEELTRTRKLRRSFLEEKYATMIQNVYGGVKQFWIEIPVKYRDGRSGVVKAEVFVNQVNNELSLIHI